MTTLASAETSLHPSATRGVATTIALWTLQLGVAALLLFAGSAKLQGDPALAATFDAIGFGRWFLYLTGGIEVVAAVLLLVPALAALGALLVVPTMIGAVATHLFVIGGSAAPAFVLLLASMAILWMRRGQLAAWLPR